MLFEAFEPIQDTCINWGDGEKEMGAEGNRGAFNGNEGVSIAVARTQRVEDAAPPCMLMHVGLRMEGDSDNSNDDGEIDDYENDGNGDGGGDEGNISGDEGFGGNGCVSPAAGGIPSGRDARFYE